MNDIKLTTTPTGLQLAFETAMKEGGGILVGALAFNQDGTRYFNHYVNASWTAVKAVAPSLDVDGETYQEWELNLDISPSSPESYYAELAWERQQLKIQKLLGGIELLQSDLRVTKQALESVKAECNSLNSEMSKLRAGGQVTKGELERLEAFKRQVRENRR